MGGMAHGVGRKDNRPKRRRPHPGEKTYADRGDPPVKLKDEPSKPALTAEAKRFQEIVEQVEADPSLVGKPAVRMMRILCGTESLKDIFGNPLVDKSGKVSTMSMDNQILYASVAAAVNSNHPKQFEFAEMLLKYLKGAPPERYEVSGPNGGPIRTENTAALSPEEMAARFVRAARIAQEIADKAKNDQAILVDAIEVGANASPEPQAPAGPVTIEPSATPPIGAMRQDALQVVKPAESKTAPPAVGMIATRR
jgi:hypothetical protein